MGGDTGTGSSNAVYYATVSSSGGVGTWASTTSYPNIIYDQSCTISSGYIYCVGGYIGSGLNVGPTSAVYYALISPPPMVTTTATTTETVTTSMTTTLPPSTITTTSLVTKSNLVVSTWAYGGMAALLIVGLAIGYIIRRASLPKS